MYNILACLTSAASASTNVEYGNHQVLARLIWFRISANKSNDE